MKKQWAQNVADAPSTNAAKQVPQMETSGGDDVRETAGSLPEKLSQPAAAPVHRPVEYDGAYKCIDCGAMWGALPGHPNEPKTCTRAQNATAPADALTEEDVESFRETLHFMCDVKNANQVDALCDLALRGLKEKG